MPPDTTRYYFSEFDEVNDHFMTLGQILVMLKESPLGVPAHERALRLLRRTFIPQFEFEERLMESCLYPKRQGQDTAHRALEAQLQALLMLAEDDPRRVEADAKLLALLERHVTLEDQDLVAFLDVIEEECEQTVTTDRYRKQQREATSG